jgi:hypothetical protein
MASVSISGDVSGAISIAAPSAAGSGVLTLPTGTDTLVGKATTDTLTNKSIAATQLTGTIAASALPAGSVLQVVSTTKTDTFSTASTTYVDITGLSVSITPRSASNKILIIYNYQTTSIGGVTAAFSRLMRDSTAIAIGDAAGSRNRGTASAYVGDAALSTNGFVLLSGNFLDSPSTTSALTYKVQMYTQSGTAYVNRSISDADNSTNQRNAASITVMEIAG